MNENNIVTYVIYLGISIMLVVFAVFVSYFISDYNLQNKVVSCYEKCDNCLNHFCTYEETNNFEYFQKYNYYLYANNHEFLKINGVGIYE